MPSGNPPVLRQSVRWGENYVSRALNEKFSGILPAGVYRGFRLKPSPLPMTVIVEHDDNWPQSVAIVERDGYSISVIMYDAGDVSIPAKGEWFVCIEAFYSPNQQGYQRIVVKEIGDVESYHAVLGKVIVLTNEATVVPLPPEAISTEGRQQNNPLSTLNPAARTELDLTHKNQAALAAQLIRLANRVTAVELEHAEHGSTGSAGLPPAGQPLPGGGNVAPLTLLPEGAEPVAGAALTAVFSEYLPPSGE